MPVAQAVLPMPVIFSKCHEVLRESIRPLHYADLTEMALNGLGITKDQVDWNKQREDVREKMLIAGQHKSSYIGKPHCLAYLLDWIPCGQLRLNVCDESIPLSSSWITANKAFYEFAMRTAYMEDKTKIASQSDIFLRRFRGLHGERIVVNWFENTWPQFYLPPENEGQWERWCSHDFKIKSKNRVFEVDVAGSRHDGLYYRPRGKHAVDIHIFWNESTEHDGIEVQGFRPGKEFSGEFAIFETRPISHLIFWLNCLEMNLDYSIFKKNNSSKAGIK